jgi:hypothetical protein
MLDILLWGAVTGLIHFCVIGAIYGNPFVDKVYAQAMKEEPGVKDWPVKPKYLVTQFLGTQVEIYVLAFAYGWLRPLLDIDGAAGTALLGLAFSGIRVFPRSWNMWIQSTYPNRLIAIESVAGVVSTFVVVFALHFLLPGA